MKKWLLRIGVVILGLVIIAVVWAYMNVRDRHPGYEVNLNIRPAATLAELKVGFAALPITPEVVDTWKDANHNAKFNEEEGDTYDDKNNNGTFDAYWIAGFGNGRAANGVHDDLWARAMVIDDGRTRLALVALDAIGFFHDDVVDVRQRLPAEAGIDYTVICSTHDHEAPDLMGLWGRSHFKSGVNPDYMEYVKQQAVQAAVQAVERMRPAKLRFARDATGASDLVTDTRKPFVKDAGLRLLHAIDAVADTTLGVLVAWASHPETLWSRNLLLSSDFPHYVREGIEKGVYDGDRLHAAGVGGIAVYINGAIGGLMTCDDDMAIQDPFADTSYVEPSFEKARAQGQRVALLGLAALANSDNVEIEKASLALRAKTIKLPLDNPLFRLGAVLGVLDRGMSGWFKMRSEVAAWTVGPASFLSVPGEIYPEIINAGIETPEGQDYAIAPIEVPPLRSLMPGDYRFVIGMSNDEIGYIIPKSEWDEKPPFLYGAKGSPYGEVNSVGPETAPIIHRELVQVLVDLKSSEVAEK